MLKQSSRLLLLVGISAAVLVLFFAFALRLTSAFSRGSGPTLPLIVATDTPDSSITIRNVSGDIGTVQPMPTYTLGMWPENYNPGGGSRVRIFARVSQQSAPLANQTVTLVALGQSYTAVTGPDGIATFTIPALGTLDTPVTVAGTVTTTDGTTLSATTSYTPV